MKRVIILTAAISMMSLTSCIDFPNLDPDSNDAIIVTDYDQTYWFGTGDQFYTYIDINNDGTNDFAFAGIVEEDPELGEVTRIKLESTNEGNHVIKKFPLSLNACQTNVTMEPIKALSSNFLISIGAQWGDMASLYTLVNPTDGCEVYRSFVRDSELHYFGVQFIANEELYFGWISISNTDFNEDGLPEMAEEWTLHQAAFNRVPATGLRVPA